MYGLLTHGAKELLGLQKAARKTKRVRVSKRFRQRIFWRDGGICQYCEKPVRYQDATMDHVQPLTRQGKHRSKENTVLACSACNKAKGPLVMDNLDDLAPDMLWMKFQRTVEATQHRQGQYVQWAAAHS